MDTAKVLGQSYPTAGALTALYTVPTGAKSVASTLKVCNQSDDETLFSVAIAVAGAADEAKQYVYHEVPIAGHDTFSATEGWTLGAGDIVRVRSQSGYCSFNLFGAEITE